MHNLNLKVWINIKAWDKCITVWLEKHERTTSRSLSVSPDSIPIPTANTYIFLRIQRFSMQTHTIIIIIVVIILNLIIIIDVIILNLKLRCSNITVSISPSQLLLLTLALSWISALRLMQGTQRDRLGNRRCDRGDPLHRLEAHPGLRPLHQWEVHQEGLRC